MPPQQLSFMSQLPTSAEEAYRWHARPGAFERLVPPWQQVDIVEQDKEIRDGNRVVLRVKVAPLIWKRWVAEYAETIVGRQFCDDQIEGPFTFWEHLHQFEPKTDKSCTLEDRIEFVPPGGIVGKVLSSGTLRRQLARMFAYRHRVTCDDLREHHRFMKQPRQKVLISGATGLVGSALVPFLSTGGHTPVRLSRGNNREDVHWNPAAKELDPHDVEGFDTVVHLAGENIAAGRWTAKQKEKIRKSRVEGTTLLAETLAKLKSPPKTLVCASAIGFYGNRGDETLTENSPVGEGFLPEVCQEWEEATAAARKAGIRVVNVRFGVILSIAGGALKKMLPPFLMGAGGKLGSGRQWMSWIALDDAVGAIHHAIMDESLSGPVNATAPHPVTNADFTKTLSRVLRRPTIFPVPAFAARLAFGELADALLLASAKVVPERLTSTGYPFRFADLEPALRHVLGRTIKPA